MAPGQALHVTGPAARYVGRGGDKLAAAIETFGLDLAGRRVLDAGASTGGFTDCALQAGAASVVAVDVGRGQLHQRLRDHPQVEVHERTNIRHVPAGDLGPPADVVVADLSFISLRTVAEALLGLAVPDADLVLLVKPQFEAGRSDVAGTRGVIADPAVWERVLRDVCDAFAGRGVTIMGLMPSPLRGADGNVEFLLHGRAGGSDRHSVAPVVGTVDALVDAALAGVRDR